ncbi:hypothetical protein [Neorhizobium petrolearium]|uniref:hypothetical protein n=1 Tax=Neorhizobium petrolearium TaxID=515361 RepID=UPI003F165AF5
MRAGVSTSQEGGQPLAGRPPSRVDSPVRKELERLYRNRAKVAELMMDNSMLAPVFERLELEIAVAEATDPVARARAVVALQRSMAIS